MSKVKIKGVFDKDFKDDVPQLTAINGGVPLIGGRRPDLFASSPYWEGIRVMDNAGVETMSVNKEGKLNVESNKMTLTAGTIDVKIDIEVYDKPHVEIADGEIVVRLGKVNIGGQK